MARRTTKKRIVSIILAVLLTFTGLLPAGTAFAADGVEGYYDIELFYKDSDTIVPSYQEDGTSDYIEYMTEGQELNLTYKLIDTEMPDNGYIKWYSETPTLVDVTQEGVVKAFDSSKGAVVQTWIDNEVKTIPLVGGAIASVIEKALFNEYIDIDSMDAEAIVDVVEGLFGSDSLLDKYIESYKGELIDSLREYLNNINTSIYVQLFDADETLLAEDYVEVCVLKSEEWYSNFLPNGTHITNKSQINTTVAVGSTVQLYAVTTPLRLKYGVVYSVKSSSIFDQGKVVATVDDSGLVTFKNTGTVTIIVSPDTEQIIEGILKLVNYIYALDNTGTLDTDQIADILIKYVGLDMNRTVLAAILDVCFAIKDVAQDVADPVQLTATAVEIIGNLVLQFIYNDTITFTVVESQPLTDFSISGANTVREGSQIQLSITDIQPEVGDTSDITWESSDPSIASVDPKTGVITGRDAGGSLGSLSTQQCTIYATSAANNITKSYQITVTGKTGKYLSDVEIQGDSYLELGEETDFTYTVYPKRVAESDNLYIDWGIQNGVDEDGNPVYIWASEDTPATNGIGTIDSKGHYVTTGGGKCTIAVKATTGYYITSENFYEISSFIGTLEVTNGIPVESIEINVNGAVGTLSELKAQKTVEINGQDYTYATVKAKTQYSGVGASVSATVYPAGASNQTLTWVVDNGDFSSEISGDTHTATVSKKVNKEYADTFNIYAVSADGRIKSNTITVCVTKNYVSSNVIDQQSIEITNGKTFDATHTISIEDGTDISYAACYKCNWYSSDESVFTVAPKNNDNCDATLTAVDVGTATLYCVSADGGIVDECQVTVYPDKERLSNIVDLCDRTIVKRTDENKSLYNDYMKKLDLAYYVLYDEPMAAQTSCDTYANELLYAFYKVGGFIGIAGVNILNTGKTPLSSDHITVKADTLTNYTKYSYDLDYEILPSTAMYSNVEWSSSSDRITVDKNGVCRPSSNDPGSAIITCTVTDYMGNSTSDSVFVTFAKTPVTGISLNTTSITGAKIGEPQTLTATVSPTPVGVVGGADCTDVYWYSSDENIAKVDQNGNLTFIEGGDCVIYCTTYDGGYTAQCTVNVITNYSALELLIQQYTDLSLNPDNYFPDSWEEYTQTLTEAQNMLATGGYSQAEVDAMTAELENAYNSLEKYNYIQKVELYLDGEQTKEFYQYDLSLLNGELQYTDAVLDLNVRLYPNNGSYASVEWASSTSDISVTGEGQCSPTIKESCYGRITCTVTDHFGNQFSDSVWVSFARYPVTSLELSQDNISGNINDTYRLTCTVYPVGSSLVHIGAASIQDYFWESDNENVATVAQDGTVTFVGAGSTVVRAVSYDGGISAECVVSCEGDRSALRQALEDYKDVDYTQYIYEFGMNFKTAYENAERVMYDNTVSQQEIDDAANELVYAYQSMLNNPFIKVENIDISYTTYAKPLVGSTDTVASGTVPSNDSLSINLSDGYSNWNSYNHITLSAGVSPAEAMYENISWSVVSTQDMDSSVNGTSVTLTPKDRGNDGAWAVLTVTVTDQYDRTYTRTITIVMSDNVMSGFDVTESDITLYATDAPRQLTYNISGSSEFPVIFWVSSDENIVKVDQNGQITPVEKGEATITAKTLDGGYTDTAHITVLTDFSTLAQKQSEYYSLIESVKDSYTYTQETLDVLSQAVSDAKTMIDSGKATQAEVNEMITRLDDAHASLKEYVPTTGVSIGYEEAEGVSSVNEGYIRYTSSVLLNGKSIALLANTEPADSVYSAISWESSNPDITVDEYGVVTNNSVSAGVTKITCTVQNVFGGEYSASVYVSFVRSGVTGISFNEEMVFGAPSDTVTLSPVIANTNNTSLSTSVVKDCIYTSSNNDIATVDNNGVVTFVSQGEATITATSLDGGFTATIKAYTTWDTSALKGAIEVAENIDYTDYAYNYGTAFKAAYDNALKVYENVYSTQDEIDLACTALTEATTALEGNEFILPEITVAQNGESVESGGYIEVDDSNAAVIDVLLNDGAMVKNTEITVSDENGVTAQVNGSGVSITKTADTGSFTLTVKTVDDYDRETTETYNFNVIAVPIPVTSITLTADGQEVTGPITHACGGSYTNFNGITIGYIPVPGNANSITSVSYTSSASNYVTVDENGLVELTTLGKIRSSNTATITCTVTNLDGTTATASVSVTITRR